NPTMGDGDDRLPIPGLYLSLGHQSPELRRSLRAHAQRGPLHPGDLHRAALSSDPAQPHHRLHGPAPEPTYLFTLPPSPPSLFSSGPRRAPRVWAARAVIG